MLTNCLSFLIYSVVCDHYTTFVPIDNSQSSFVSKTTRSSTRHCAKAGVLGRFAAYRAGTPVIVHTCHAFGNQVTRSPTNSSLRKVFSQAKGKLFVSAERCAGRVSDRVITVCEQNRRQAIQWKLASNEKVSTIYSGIDLDRFAARGNRSKVFAEFGFDPSRPLVGLIGRLAEQKAPLDFVAAAKLVLAKHPDAQFVIAGDGPLADQVLAATKQKPSIRSIGFYDRVPELMSVLDVLAVSSLWEGLGRSVTEAMIMGVPVAATAVDGIPELIKHQETGLLSSPSDISSLAQNISRLLNNPDEARAMADLAQQRVADDFDGNQMVTKIDNLYHHLLREKGLPHASVPVGKRTLAMKEATRTTTRERQSESDNHAEAAFI